MTANDFLCFSDGLEMVSQWKNLGFICDVSDEGTPEPLFLEVARIKPRLLHEDQPTCENPCEK